VRDVLDLGNGHTLRFFSDGQGNRIGATVSHPCPTADQGECTGAIYFDLPATHEFEKRDRVHPKWTIVKEDPLTLAPSIRHTGACNVHGFIREGKWVDA
jgi:hypothetical protein